MIGDMFMGIGAMVLMFVLAYFMYQIARMISTLADKENKYEMYEEMVLTEHAKKKGYDLDKEAIKRSILPKKKRSFRRRVEQEMYDQMFGKDKKDK